MGLIAALGMVFPRQVGNYLVNRRYLEQCQRLYEAASSSDYRPVVGNDASADTVIHQAGTRLRNQSRFLDENHDLACSVLDDLVNNTVGDGILVAPMMRDSSGRLAADANRQAAELFEAWAEAPETTDSLGWVEVQRLARRTKFRDGEVFTQLVTGGGYRYRSPVPLVLELLEPDFCPLEYNDPTQNIFHGIKLDAWRRPLAYYFYKQHPGNYLGGYGAASVRDMKGVPAERILQEKFTRRLHQLRGVTVFHAVINRLRDIKDYEESERIAAKVAADMTGFIQRDGNYQSPTTNASTGKRNLRMQAGAIYELNVGESVGTIGHTRPNAELNNFRNAMLRATAGGTGTRYSGISRNFDGTYSAQRQELVEGAIGYRALFRQDVRSFHRPIYTAFIEQALYSGALRLPRDVDMSTIYRADFRAPALPWIDPQKEANAWKILLDARLESHAEIQRLRGRDPAKVQEEIEQETEAGLFSSAITDVQPASVIEDDEEQPRMRARA